LVVVTPAALAGDMTFDGYEMQKVGDLPVTQARSVMLIVDGFLPSIEEPLDTQLLSLDISGNEGALIVEVALRGYQDDSIMGENFKARLEADGSQWHIVALGRQVICARGPNAGRPSTTCP
jgi:hypothetical protein